MRNRRETRGGSVPGLVGFTCVAKHNPNPGLVLRRMQDMITHHDFYERDELFCDNYLCATRSHLGSIGRKPQPFHGDGIYVWLDGEFYNQEEIAPQRTSASGDPELLHTLLKQSSDCSFLKQIDGFFSAVIYDSINKEVRLITDRCGLRSLYWTVHKGDLVWASEAKAMLALPDFEPTIDSQAVQDFFGFGYLLKDRTWFEGVELLPSGTVLTWDIRQRSVKTQRYWYWDEIRPLAEKIDERELTDELGRLFRQAVKRRCREGERVGLMLSGGLDSRAILAAMPDGGYPIHVVTYGRRGCEDIRIAAMAAMVKGAMHRPVEINERNWLIRRLDGVWWMDGEKDLMHMHGIEAYPETRGLFDISLDGFLGDATIGGSYLGDPSVSEIDKIENRGRRFILLGIRLGGVYFGERMPFFDNNFVGLTLAIPARLRANSRIYNKMLLRAFPEFFRSIPWQKTGISINWPASITEGVLSLRRVRNRLTRGLRRLGYHYSNSEGYTDYPNWIRQEPARSFLEKALTNSSAIYPNYIQKDQVCRELAKHFDGDDSAEVLCRYLTFEVWLQQIFEGRFRSGHA